ncbi:MAG TPA: Hsp20/alpha crystallin family protein [bacterium]|nr:Hsp20/alpha crystallin family protein [bacterium]HPN67264.1 Hsp20/alpha crystallin family protein [bacterium]
MSKWLIPWGNDDLESWFDEPFFGRKHTMMGGPIVNIFEKDGKVVMEFELPGVDEKNLEVEITDKMVMVRGHSKEEKEEKNKKYYRMESRMSSFSRQIAWPEMVKESTAVAELKDGVLTVSAEKMVEKKATKLLVKKIGKK